MRKKHQNKAICKFSAKVKPSHSDSRVIWFTYHLLFVSTHSYTILFADNSFAKISGKQSATWEAPGKPHTHLGSTGALQSSGKIVVTLGSTRGATFAAWKFYHVLTIVWPGTTGTTTTRRILFVSPKSEFCRTANVTDTGYCAMFRIRPGLVWCMK